MFIASVEYVYFGPCYSEFPQRKCESEANPVGKVEFTKMWL